VLRTERLTARVFLTARGCVATARSDVDGRRKLSDNTVVTCGTKRRFVGQNYSSSDQTRWRGGPEVSIKSGALFAV
jgi:hypothetical protein